MRTQAQGHRTLADELEHDPGRFEPTTAFRVAQEATHDLVHDTPGGAEPAALPVARFKRYDDKGSVRTTLASLSGPLGSLPPAYDELLMRQRRRRSHGLAVFLDIFASRLAELFVDASEKYRLPRLLRWNGNNQRNRFLTTLLSLAGLGTAGLERRSGVERDVVLRFSGFFSSRTRNASNLEAMLNEFTGLPITVALFRPRWLAIPEGEQSCMNRQSGVQLGVNATAGNAVRDLSGGFRIVIGPLGYEDYLALSPNSTNVRDIFTLTRLFVGPTLDFDLQIVLRKDEIPFGRLGGAVEPSRLGWNSWARVAPAVADSGDAIIRAPKSSMSFDDAA